MRARQSINPVIEKNWGNFILRDICERKTEPILLAFACDLCLLSRESVLCAAYIPDVSRLAPRVSGLMLF